MTDAIQLARLKTKNLANQEICEVGYIIDVNRRLLNLIETGTYSRNSEFADSHFATGESGSNQ